MNMNMTKKIKQQEKERRNNWIKLLKTRLCCRPPRKGKHCNKCYYCENIDLVIKELENAGSYSPKL